MPSPVEVQVAEQLKAERNFDYGNQVKSALKNPQLERGLIQGLKELMEKPGTTRFHELKGGNNLYAMNVGSEAGSGGARVIFHKQDEGRFVVVGLFSDHDYKAWERNRNGSFDAKRSMEIPEHSAHAKIGKGAKAGGIVGGVLTIAAGAADAAESQGRSARAGDYLRAAWNQTIGEPLVKGRYAEAVMRVLEKGDPTLGVISSGIRSIFGAAGADVDPGVTESIKKLPSGALRELKQNALKVGYLQRDQFFLLQSVGLTELRDDDGKRKDVGAILRSSEQRASFLQHLNRAYEYEQVPQKKENLKQMIGACHDYVEVERERQTVLNRTVAILEQSQSPRIVATQTPDRPAPIGAKLSA